MSVDFTSSHICRSGTWITALFVSRARRRALSCSKSQPLEGALASLFLPPVSNSRHDLIKKKILVLYVTFVSRWRTREREKYMLPQLSSSEVYSSHAKRHFLYMTDSTGLVALPSELMVKMLLTKNVTSRIKVLIQLIR